MQVNKQMTTLMSYLAEAEKTHIHRLDGELDITAMYGIYRHANPQAKVFTEIDYLAFNLGIKKESRYWTGSEINFLNEYIKKNHLENKFYLLAVEFYQEYYKRARLDSFPKECVVAMASMYANSRRISWKAVQYAINTMHKNGFISYKDIKEDSRVGSNTLKGLELCLNASINSKYLGYLFESFMLLGMSAEYSLLIKRKPERYIRFSTGWDNRLKILQQRR